MTSSEGLCKESCDVRGCLWAPYSTTYLPRKTSLYVPYLLFTVHGDYRYRKRRKVMSCFPCCPPFPHVNWISFSEIYLRFAYCQGKRNACIWDALFDKKVIHIRCLYCKSIYHTRRLVYQEKTSEMFQTCLWENLTVIIMNQSEATSWLCSLNVARSSCRNVFSGCESLFWAEDVRCKTCVSYYMTTPLSPYSK